MVQTPITRTAIIIKFQFKTDLKIPSLRVYFALLIIRFKLILPKTSTDENNCGQKWQGILTLKSGQGIPEIN